MVGDTGEVHLWGRGEGAVVSTCMQGWGIGRGHTARAVHTSDIACAMPLSMSTAIAMPGRPLRAS